MSRKKQPKYLGSCPGCSIALYEGQHPCLGRESKSSRAGSIGVAAIQLLAMCESTKRMPKRVAVACKALRDSFGDEFVSSVDAPGGSLPTNAGPVADGTLRLEAVYWHHDNSLKYASAVELSVAAYMAGASRK